MKTIKTKSREQTAVLMAATSNINFSCLRIVEYLKTSKNNFVGRLSDFASEISLNKYWKCQIESM